MFNVALFTNMPFCKMYLLLQIFFLNVSFPGTKEVASACNHSLMKLVTPEDDEDDEDTQTKSSPPSDEAPY